MSYGDDQENVSIDLLGYVICFYLLRNLSSVGGNIVSFCCLENEHRSLLYLSAGPFMMISFLRVSHDGNVSRISYFLTHSKSSRTYYACGLRLSFSIQSTLIY